jgi:hypothetical protein
MLRQLMRVPLSKPTQRLAGQLYPEDIHIYQFTQHVWLSWFYNKVQQQGLGPLLRCVGVCPSRRQSSYASGCRACCSALPNLLLGGVPHAGRPSLQQQSHGQTATAAVGDALWVGSQVDCFGP